MWLSKLLVTVIVGQCLNLVKAGNFYDEDPYLMELTPKNFDKIIHKTNYTTLVEFYAPWCGYCQRLRPIMHKVAKKLHGVMPVASVNCDSPKNKQLCAKNRIDGLPTLMVFRPPKIDMSKSYDRRIQFNNHGGQRYDSERKVAPIVDFSLSRLNNYVRRVLSLEKLMQAFDKSTRPSVVLFSKNDKLSPIYKSIAIDWLGIVNCFIIPNSRLNVLPSVNGLDKLYPRIYNFLEGMVNDRQSSRSRIVLFDPRKDQYYVYEGDSLVKPLVTDFLKKSVGSSPQEGPGSKRQTFINFIQSNKHKTSSHDEL